LVSVKSYAPVTLPTVAVNVIGLPTQTVLSSVLKPVTVGKVT